MTANALLEELRRRGVRLSANGDRLRVSAPPGALDPRLRDLLAARKEEILATLRGATGAAGPRPQPPPLEPAPRDRPLVLSFAQERLWFLDRLAPGSPAYNIPLGVRIQGPLRVDVLERTLGAIVQRHEVLRTGCATRDGEPVLEPMASDGSAAEPVVPVPVHDLRDRLPADRNEEWDRLVALEARRPFDLARPPFLRAILARLDDAAWTGLLVTHHFVADGWSMGILLREVGALYHAFARDLPSPLPPLPVQYADYAAWQRAWLGGGELESQLGVWRARLAGMPAVLDLPADRARPPLRSGLGGRVPFTTSPDLADALRALARSSSATLFMVLLAAFHVLLGRYARSRDVVVATAVSNRRRLETESLVGFFANNLVLRGDLDGDPTFRELVERTRVVAVEAYANQDVPFEKLVEDLRPGRDLGHTPLFQVMFVLENAPPPVVRLSELALEAFEVDTGSARFDLTLALRETPHGLAGSLEYDADLFAAASAARLLEHYRTLLEAACRNPDQRLSELPLASAAEQAGALATWNDTARSWGGFRPLHARIADQARRTPGAIAVECDGEALTYAELESRANRLAHRLRREGLRPDACAAVLLERSLDLSVALLAVLKAGAAYVPLDPAYPVDRLRFMLEDCGARLVLTRSELAGRLLPEEGAASGRPRRLLLDQEAAALAGEADDDPAVPV
ncbi:MAG: condensation domain-containing protein, partial [Candidatus Eisenbacteria bacterium]